MEVKVPFFDQLVEVFRPIDHHLVGFVESQLKRSRMDGQEGHGDGRMAYLNRIIAAIEWVVTGRLIRT